MLERVLADLGDAQPQRWVRVATRLASYFVLADGFAAGRQRARAYAAAATECALETADSQVVAAVLHVRHLTM
jgi:hypothetical protein